MISAPWRAEPDEIAQRLDVDPAQGLEPAEARRRLRETGPNRLDEPPARPWWRLLFAQVANPLAVTLAAAAAVAGAVERSYREAIAIGVALALNGVLGFAQERRSERAVAELKLLLSPTARVRRGGAVLAVPAADLVPGDVVLVRAGDQIPADGRVLRAVSLEIDESGLTGESLPVAKSATSLVGDAGLADRTSMCHMTGAVTRGSGELLVTATGMRTEVGQVAGLLADTDVEPTPLQRQLDRLGLRLALLAAIAVVAVAAVLWLAGGQLGEVITVAVALGVAAIPEGLPAAVAVTLTLGMRKMAAQRAIVKRLPAVETLGATTVICTDKTGTLTVNQMTARSVWYAGRGYLISGEGYAPDGTIAALDGGAVPDLRGLLVPAVLCGDAVVHGGQLVGDPIEGALVVLAGKAGLDVAGERAAAPRIAEIPFDPDLRYMATFHRSGAKTRACVKGAADVLLALATHVRTELGDVELTDSAREGLTAEIERFAERGERVLAVAIGDAEPGVLPAQLLLLGLAGVMDPPRPEAADAIAECRAAGIEVKMITGDHPATATAVAQAVGIGGPVLSGADIERLDDASLTRAGVLARVAPADKIRVVRALRRAGHVVAMTGDGVNDAPALKGADIGVAMGRTGSDVAKEAAAMILADDNFATIVTAVRRGRTIRDNIVKFVRFQVSTNVAAIFAMAAGSVLLAGASLMTPLMLLWVNVIADGPPALALGLEPARPGVMRERPQRTDVQILTGRRLGWIAAAAAVMAAGTLAAFWLGLGRGFAAARTLAFTTFVLYQLFNLLNVRDERDSAFGPMLARNWRLWAAMGSVVVLHAAAVYLPFAQGLFATTTLTPIDWLIAAAIASTVLWLEELRKAAARQRIGSKPRRGGRSSRLR
ncbi:cation-transporting P-type ATPase [Kutzneria buriramensis]|uniref:Ca2+-transporting ATPase n=1 Tax=Kutzneria buriramensis TaxID=1045776 RepID=A0A3E0H0C9_9PSEU|nr:cation-transporting P-type ATPase [Kutzneria buriramensis]REH34880.1 Ca2+-transporting ATPase [Kutzneria buriramensis]